MTPIEILVRTAGGLLHKRELVAAGARDRDLTRAVRSGRVRRPRRGWYSTWPPEDPRFVAVRVGGRLTGLAALALLGAWSWPGQYGPVPITVSVPRNAARLRRREGVRVVHDGPDVRARGSTWSVDTRDALRRAITEATFEEAVALIDWAVHSRALTAQDLEEVRLMLPADARNVFDWSDPFCESFPESVTRTRCRRAGHLVRSQGPLPNGQRVDLVIDGVVGLEVDGRAFHGDRFEEDRRKDLEIAAAGFAPLRLTVTMIRDTWTPALRALERLVSVQRKRPEPGLGPGPRYAPFPRVLPGRGRRRPWRLGRVPRSVGANST